MTDAVLFAYQLKLQLFLIALKIDGPRWLADTIHSGLAFDFGLISPLFWIISGSFTVIKVS